MLEQTVSQFRLNFQRVQRDINGIQHLILQTWIGGVNGRVWYTTARKLNELGFEVVERFKDRLQSDYYFQCLRYALYKLIASDSISVEDIAKSFSVELCDLKYLHQSIAKTSFQPPEISADFSPKDILSRDEVLDLVQDNEAYISRLIRSQDFNYLVKTYTSLDSLKNQLFFKAWVVALRHLEQPVHMLRNTLKRSIRNYLCDIARRYTARQRNPFAQSNRTLVHGTIRIEREESCISVTQAAEQRWEIVIDGARFFIEQVEGSILFESHVIEQPIPISGRWSIDKELIYFDTEPVGKWCNYEERAEFDLREFSLEGNCTEDFDLDRNINLVDVRAEAAQNVLDFNLDGGRIFEDDHLQLMSIAENYYDRDLFRDAIPLLKKIVRDNSNSKWIAMLADCFYETRQYYWAWRYYRQVERVQGVASILRELERYNFARGIRPGQYAVYRVSGNLRCGRIVAKVKSKVLILNTRSFEIEEVRKSKIYVFADEPSALDDFDIVRDLNRTICVKIGTRSGVVARTLAALPEGYLVLCISAFPGHQRVIRYGDVSQCPTQSLLRLKSL